MIYNPSPPEMAWLVTLRNAIGAGATQAGLLAAADFANRTNQDWSFYAGVFTGTAVATGRPGAALTMYIIGDILDYHVFKSPAGGQFRVFLNGVQLSTVDTYLGTAAWEALQLTLTGNPAGYNRVDFVNVGPSPSNPDPDPESWFGMAAPFTVTGGQELIMTTGGSAAGKPWSITFTIADARDKRAKTTVYYPSSATYTEVYDYARDLAAALQDVIAGEVLYIEITQDAGLPGGLKVAPRLTADVEQRLTFTFRAGSGKTKLTVPTWDDALLYTDNKNRRADLGDAQVLRLIDLLKNADVLDRVSDERGVLVTDFVLSQHRFKSS